MSRADRIARYIERQYLTELGTARDNVEALFAEDFAYHVGGETLSREDLITIVVESRISPREGRRMAPSDFVEEGNVVRWHLSARFPNAGADGGDLVQESELRAAFNAVDLIQEVWSEDAAAD